MRKYSERSTLSPSRTFAMLPRPARSRMKAGIIGSLATAAIGICFTANAAIMTVPVDFTANQSLWGSGGSLDFRAYDSGSFVGISYSYDIGASTGNVAAAYQGGISISYNPYMSAPGTTTIGLNFVGDTNGGNISSNLGAWANVNVGGLDIVDEGYSFNIEESFTPQLGQTASGEDATTLGGYGIDIGIASAGANLDLQQTDALTVTKIEGDLVATLEGTSTSITTPFSLSSSGLNFDLGLNEIGIWDVSFQNLTLENLFSTSFDAALILYEEHISGISICYFTVHTFFGNFRIYYPCGVAFDENTFTLADIDVYDGDPFSLDFGNISPLQSFSISVGVEPDPTIPEPPSWALVAISLASLVVLHRRRIEVPRKSTGMV